MQFLRLDLQDAAGAIASQTTGLFHEEGEGIAFVQQPQLAVGRLGGAGVEVDAALQQVAVEVGRQAADVAGAVAALLAGIDVGAHALGEVV